MKTKLIICLLFIFGLILFKNASGDDFSDAILKTRKEFNAATNKNDKDALIKVRGQFERILQLKKNVWLVNYYIAHVDFMLSYAVMTDNKPNDDVKKYTESSLNMLDKCTNLKDDFAEAYILKMAVNSNRFMYEPDKLNDIIGKISENKATAIKLDPDNPRIYVIDGMNTYYTPEAFGGGADNALPILKKAYDLFQTYKPADETYPTWGNDLACGMLALCEIKLGKLDEAKKYMDKALGINPDSGLIKNEVQKEYDKANTK